MSEEAEVQAKPAETGEWPKWVPVHESHVVRKIMDGAPVHISVPGFVEHFVNRVTGEVTVLVHDAEDEAKALSELADKAASAPIEPAKEDNA